MKKLILGRVVAIALIGLGCDNASETRGTGSTDRSTTATPASPDVASTQPAASSEHNRLPIGEATVGEMKLVATMDVPVKATGGGECAFDVVITGGKPKSVRFWIGTEDAKGSVKAKAEEETTENWHSHAEVPNPLPAGSKFWVEVEPPTGEKFVRSFELRVQ